MTNVVKLHEGDPIAGELVLAIREIVYGRFSGCSFATVMGAIDIAKQEIFNEQVAHERGEK